MLTHQFVADIRKRGRYPDGESGLVLEVDADLFRDYRFVFVADGVSYDVRIGAHWRYRLHEARVLVERCRNILASADGAADLLAREKGGELAREFANMVEEMRAAAKRDERAARCALLERRVTRRAALDVRPARAVQPAAATERAALEACNAQPAADATPAARRSAEIAAFFRSWCGPGHVAR